MHFIRSSNKQLLIIHLFFSSKIFYLEKSICHIFLCFKQTSLWRLKHDLTRVLPVRDWGMKCIILFFSLTTISATMNFPCLLSILAHLKKFSLSHTSWMFFFLLLLVVFFSCYVYAADDLSKAKKVLKCRRHAIAIIFLKFLIKQSKSIYSQWD